MTCFQVLFKTYVKLIEFNSVCICSNHFPTSPCHLCLPVDKIHHFSPAVRRHETKLFEIICWCYLDNEGGIGVQQKPQNRRKIHPKPQNRKQNRQNRKPHTKLYTQIGPNRKKIGKTKNHIGYQNRKIASIFYETENQMLKNEKSANRIEHQNRKTDVF